MGRVMVVLLTDGRANVSLAKSNDDPDADAEKPSQVGVRCLQGRPGSLGQVVLELWALGGAARGQASLKCGQERAVPPVDAVCGRSAEACCLRRTS